MFLFSISVVSATDGASLDSIKPVASFTANAISGSAPLVVLFTDTSTGAPTSWYWDFGDGIDSKHAQTATHTFTNPGTYTVTLTVTNGAGSDTVRKTGYITVFSASEVPETSDTSQKPTATFTADVTTGYAPLGVQFTSETTGDPTSYYWIFEPETSNDWNSHHPVTAVHTFKNPGVYTVSLDVTNSAGSYTVTEPNYITVLDPSAPTPTQKPTASFTADVTSGKVPLAVTFTDTSTGGLPTSWLWDFGDGETSTVQNPTHTYVEAGSYTVKLTVSNDAGSNTISKPGYVVTSVKEQPAYTQTNSENSDHRTNSVNDNHQTATVNNNYQITTVNNNYNNNTHTEPHESTSIEKPVPSSASVSLRGEKTNFVKGEEILLKLSAVNLITKPTMHVQAIIIPPSGMSVSSSEFVESGAGQYTATYDLEPGEGKDIEVRIVANQVGNFNVNGRVVYYFGENKKNVEDYTLDLPIYVKEAPDTSEVQPMPEPTPETHNATSGFGVGSITLILLVAFILRRN